MNDEEADFVVWWAKMQRKAAAIIAEHREPGLADTPALRRLVIHAYVAGEMDEVKDATAKANARTEQLRAELEARRRRGK